MFWLIFVYNVSENSINCLLLNNLRFEIKIKRKKQLWMDILEERAWIKNLNVFINLYILHVYTCTCTSPSFFFMQPTGKQ